MLKNGLAFESWVYFRKNGNKIVVIYSFKSWIIYNIKFDGMKLSSYFATNNVGQCLNNLSSKYRESNVDPESEELVRIAMSHGDCVQRPAWTVWWVWVRGVDPGTPTPARPGAGGTATGWAHTHTQTSNKSGFSKRHLASLDPGMGLIKKNKKNKFKNTNVRL